MQNALCKKKTKKGIKDNGVYVTTSREYVLRDLADHETELDS